MKPLTAAIVLIGISTGCMVQTSPPAATAEERQDEDLTRYKDNPDAFVGKTLGGRFRYATNLTLRDWIGQSAYFSRSVRRSNSGTYVDVDVYAEMPKTLEYPNVTRLEEVDITFLVRGGGQNPVLLTIRRPE